MIGRTDLEGLLGRYLAGVILVEEQHARSEAGRKAVFDITWSIHGLPHGALWASP